MSKFVTQFSQALLLTVIIGSGVSFFSPGVHAASRDDARTVLVTMAETGSHSATVEEVRKLVELYRMDRGSALLPLAEAPYPRFLINSQIAEIYPALYKTAFQDFLDHIPLDLLFDGVLGMVATDKVPPEMKKDLSKIGARMAKRALEGKSEKCEIDLSDKIDEPSTLSLIALKIDFLSVISACIYRTRLFNAMKPKLIEAAKTPETKKVVAEQAKDLFPVEFRKGFLSKINTTIAGFPTLINKKMGACEKADKKESPLFGFSNPFSTLSKTTDDCASLHPIWGENGSVIELESDTVVRGGRRELSLKGFSQGLLADLYAARILIESPVARDRSLAAGLFYAVVNRWLYLTGGITADWDSKRKEMPVAVMGEKMNPPKFKEVPFGGWGAEADGFGVAMSAWDWGGYNPTAEQNPTPFRLFPTRFEIDSNGVGSISDLADAVQTNDDLSYMLLAVSEFLKATQPGTPFAKYFGGKDQVGDLLDDKKPMLFPSEGRMVAVGVLAAVAQNLLHPVYGHVKNKEDISILFRDRASFGTMVDTDVDTRGAASLLVAASKLRRVLKNDPILNDEPKLNSVMGDVAKLVQVGALAIGRDSQGYDGSIRAKMRSSDPAVTLASQIAAIRVLLVALNDADDASRATFFQARLVPALQYFFNVQLSDPSGLNLEARLNVLAVWNQCQAELRAVRTDLPWADWEQKVRNVNAMR